MTFPKVISVNFCISWLRRVTRVPQKELIPTAFTVRGKKVVIRSSRIWKELWPRVKINHLHNSRNTFTGTWSSTMICNRLQNVFSPFLSLFLFVFASKNFIYAINFLTSRLGELLNSNTVFIKNNAQSKFQYKKRIIRNFLIVCGTILFFNRDRY